MENIEALIEEVKNWDAKDADDTGNLLHRYFRATELRDWCAVADEGLRVHKWMFNEEVQQYSPLDSHISAVAAQSAHGVYAALAAALGLEVKYLQFVLAAWDELDPADPDPPPISIKEFMQRYKKEKAEWEAQHANH